MQHAISQRKIFSQKVLAAVPLMCRSTLWMTIMVPQILCHQALAMRIMPDLLRHQIV